MWNPALWLAAVTLLFATDSVVYVLRGAEVPSTTESLFTLSFAVLAGWWVHADRRARSLGAPFEFDAFAIFWWPILVPYYMVRTRGPKGLVAGACLWLLYLVPWLAGWAAYMLVARA